MLAKEGDAHPNSNIIIQMSISYEFDELSTLSQAISQDLTLLSALHATELKAQTLLELKTLGFPEGLGLQLHSDQSAPILKHLKEVVQKWPDQADDALLDNLAADYAAIYLNSQIGSSPHESFWLDEEHLVMQKPMFEVRDKYREYGLKVDNWRSRADDNIVNELSFLAYVIQSEQPLKGFSVVAQFLDEHLLRWVGSFSERVAGFSQSDFYSGLGLLTAVYCDELRDLLASLLNEPRPSAEEIAKRMSEKEKKGPIKVAPPQFAAGPGW